jgi:hypothetical protein
MKNNDDIAEAVMGWIILLRILLGACCVGLVLTVIKAILLSFGIDIGL